MFGFYVSKIAIQRARFLLGKIDSGWLSKIEGTYIFEDVLKFLCVEILEKQ